MDPHPGRGQHPRPAARAHPAAGDRQGTARGGGEGTRAVVAALPGGAGVAAGRLLGAGAPPVRHRQRPVMTRPPAVPPTEPASPEAALPGAVPSETVPSETVPFELVSGGATAVEFPAPTAALANIAASRRNVVPVGGPTAMSIWAERSRL